MIGTKLEFNTPDEVEAVYYESFMRCDRDVMAALWADGDVICIHPGSGAIVGAGSVVTKNHDVPKGKTVVGIPAKILKKGKSHGK